MSVSPFSSLGNPFLASLESDEEGKVDLHVVRLNHPDLAPLDTQLVSLHILRLYISQFRRYLTAQFGLV